MREKGITNEFSQHYNWTPCIEAWIREIKQNDGSEVTSYQGQWKTLVKKLESLKGVASNEYKNYLNQDY